MSFHYSHHNLKGKEKISERFFEILPGATSWCVLIGMFVLCMTKPLIAAVILIAYDLHWILRLFYMNIFLELSFLRLSMESTTDWKARYEALDDLDTYIENIKFASPGKSIKDKISLFIHRKEIIYLKKSTSIPPLSKDIYHVIIIPVAKETREIVEPGIKSYAYGKFPPEKMLVIIGLEEWASEEVKQGIYEIQKKYRGCFFDFFVQVHPSDLPGEARVKGANVTCAAKRAAEFFASRGIPYEHVILSCFDADTVVSADYFNSLTYHYMITPARTQASFQPIPVYYNNFWQTPSFARVLDVGSSFFQLAEATNPGTLVTYSSHSMSFKALVDIGYWPVDMISDDSAIFWKAFIHFEGKYQVVPIYVTLSMDVTQDETWWKTFVNVYKQKRRWAWGVENFPIIMRGFFRSKNIPFSLKLKHGFKLFESSISWATMSFLLTVYAWLPALFASRKFEESIVYYSGPRITNTIYSLALIGIVNCILLSLLLLPKKRIHNNLFQRIRHAFEWLLVPVISIFLSAIPALDAQTRLMLGKYMEFWITVKKRVSQEEVDLILK